MSWRLPIGVILTSQRCPCCGTCDDSKGKKDFRILDAQSIFASNPAGKLTVEQVERESQSSRCTKPYHKREGHEILRRL